MAMMDMPDKDISSLDNSFKRKMEEGEKKIAPKMEKIVHDRKPTFAESLTNIFANDIRNAAEDFIEDEVIPGVLHGCIDFLKTWFFGGRGRDRDYRDWDDDYYDSPSYYHDRYKRRDRRRDDYDRRDRRRDDYDRRDPRRIDYRRVVISPGRGETMTDAKYEAQRVVKALRSRIADYGQASVADLLDACGYESSWVDTDRGWIDENDIGLQVVRGGYLIDVAEATELR